MIVKTLALLATVAAASFVVKRMTQNPQPKPVRVKPHPHADGRIRQLRQDPKTGEYYAKD